VPSTAKFIFFLCILLWRLKKKAWKENATLKSSCERKMAILKKILTDLYKVATEEHL